MMPIWEPLSKIVITDSNTTNIRPGATGFVVLLTDDAMGFRSYWGIDLILTRNGKKGQRHLFYRRTRIKKLEYADLFKPSVIELISKEMLYEEGFEPRLNRKLECIKIEKDPYKSKNMLDWDVWDFLGWITAASQLCSLMVDPKLIKNRIRTGLPTVSRPSVAPMAVGPEGIDILNVKAEELVGFFLYMPTDKSVMTTLKKAFNEESVRTVLIEKMRRAFAYGQSIYTDMKNETDLIYSNYLSDLSRSVTYETNPDKKLEDQKMKKDPYEKAKKVAKNTWNRVAQRYINRDADFRIVAPELEPIRVAEPGFIHSEPMTVSLNNNQPSLAGLENDPQTQYYIRTITLGSGSVTLSSGSVPATPTPTRIVELEPPPLIHRPIEQLEAEPEDIEEEYIEEDLEEDSEFDISHEVAELLKTIERHKKHSGGSSADNR